MVGGSDHPRNKCRFGIQLLLHAGPKITCGSGLWKIGENGGSYEFQRDFSSEWAIYFVFSRPTCGYDHLGSWLHQQANPERVLIGKFNKIRRLCHHWEGGILLVARPKTLREWVRSRGILNGYINRQIKIGDEHSLANSLEVCTSTILPKVESYLLLN